MRKSGQTTIFSAEFLSVCSSSLNTLTQTDETNTNEHTRLNRLNGKIHSGWSGFSKAFNSHQPESTLWCAERVDIFSLFWPSAHIVLFVFFLFPSVEPHIIMVIFQLDSSASFYLILRMIGKWIYTLVVFVCEFLCVWENGFLCAVRREYVFPTCRKCVFFSHIARSECDPWPIWRGKKTILISCSPNIEKISPEKWK